MILTLAFLLTALTAYVLFGGADFGGGVLEATLRRHPRLQDTLQRAMGPVWEANHVWLIAVVVILFVGFPVAYARLMTQLFVPVSLALLGIILRGAFFTFRKYDPEPARRLGLYALLFRASSALTPVMFGMIVAALLGGLPGKTPADATFADLYVKPWATWFGLACGLFVTALFGYLAAVFLFGETRDPADHLVLRRRVVQFFGVTFLLGGAVLGVGAWSGRIDPVAKFTLLQAAVQLGAALCIPLLWRAMNARRPWRMRLIAGAQLLFILGGWFETQTPDFARYADGTALTVAQSAAPPVTLLWLNIGLAAVLAAVVPLLAWLYRVFDAGRDR
ncbi:MAG TPA: cytochrome d ubiquinol oxidase subunit II [Candidatus Krumholzibacteria bacterium]|nr:cytochrome d ubiquinol oxidase subunit II [Candidatus Krumholzibacteria bacterium]